MHIGRPLLAVLLLGMLGCSRLDAPKDSSSNDDGNPGPVPTFNGSASTHVGVSLTSIAPEINRLRVDWTSTGLDAFTGDFALYISTDRSNLFNATPVALDITQGSTIFSGLSDLTEYFVGMGVAADTGDPLLPRDLVLSAKTGALIYVDLAAPSMGADGLSPATAFPSLFAGVFTAFLNGGGNVLAAEGDYSDTSLPLLAGVDLYGGYTPSFSLADRDAGLHATRLLGLAADSVLKIEANAELQRVDGLRIDGLGASINGIDIDRTASQITNVNIRDCTRGMRLRSPALSDSNSIVLSNVRCDSNRIEGVSLEGPFDVHINACTFQSNGQEGLEFGPWIGPSNDTIRLRVRGSRFLANGFEGLDVDMVAAPDLGPGGTFVVDIVDCDFEQNLGSGCLIDVDFEATPAWDLELSIRGSKALANRESGFLLDIDSNSICVLQRVLASANGNNGLSVTSETYAAMVMVSSSAFVGNLAYGVRTSLGNVGVALSHCLLLGNASGGLRDDLAPASLASSAAQLQFSPFGMGHLRGTSSLPDSPSAFEYAALEYRNLNAQSGDMLTLDSALGAGTGQAVELGADGILRVLDTVTVNVIQVTPTPSGLQLPALFTLYGGARLLARRGLCPDRGRHGAADGSHARCGPLWIACQRSTGHRGALPACPLSRHPAKPCLGPADRLEQRAAHRVQRRRALCGQPSKRPACGRFPGRRADRKHRAAG
jgi:hypothetical protein